MQTYNQNAFPPFRRGPEAEPIKNAHDQYDVYVNEEYIGKKTLLTQSEEVEDIVDFLKVQGIEGVSTHLDGDHFVIKSEEPEHLKQILQTYLNNL
ncbi:hypothetical protein SAMN05192533_1238 [Mesobacillus persicus]|uniref:Uncharacterized protein n=1 Tax=Mesobacillus persicus TaxID=930146 RepID=A0A1H8JVX2_9BACI|nr:hypothetical protein [Mesobacillus persicus]SEN84839.1 hypothetical protein SAMN05192533_1238 [Mesobacillus persicus]